MLILYVAAVSESGYTVNVPHHEDYLVYNESVDFAHRLVEFRAGLEPVSNISSFVKLLPPILLAGLGSAPEGGGQGGQTAEGTPTNPCLCPSRGSSNQTG